MPNDAGTPPNLASGRSLSDFPDRSSAEDLLLARCKTGTIANVDPPVLRPAAASPSNTIRAGFLRFLALGGNDEAPVHERGVELAGAWIEGDLDFECCELRRINLKSCTINGRISLRDAKLPALNLEDCSFNGIIANRLECNGIYLSRNFLCKGEFWIQNANISGTLSLTGGRIENPGAIALNADGIVAGRVFLREKFYAQGSVRLVSAKIVGDLDCEDGTFENGSDEALYCDAAEIGGRVFLRNGFHAIGGVRFMDAAIGADFDCSGGRFDNPEGVALRCDSVEVRGRALLRHGFRSEGEVRFLNGNLGGLACDAGHFDNFGAGALNCNNVTIDGGVYLTNGFYAIGEVQFIGATLKNDLDCTNGWFRNVARTALNCDGASIANRVFLRDGLYARGEIRFVSARIGGTVDCRSATLDNRYGVALNCSGAVIESNLVLVQQMLIYGDVRLVGAGIGGDFACENMSFGDSSLICDRAKITGAFEFRSVIGYSNLFVSLTAAKAAILADDAQSWQAVTHVDLDGFAYDQLSGGAATDSDSRLAWLELQVPDHLGKNFRPQPWQQLARVLQQMGHENDAKKIRIGMRDRQRVCFLLNCATRWSKLKGRAATFFDWVTGWLLGYGYRPWRPVWWLLVLWAIGVAVFWNAARVDAMMPVESDVFFSERVPPECLDNLLTLEGPRLPVATDDPWDQAQAQQAAQADLKRRDEAARKLKINTWSPPTWVEICARAVPSKFASFNPLLYSLDLIVPLFDLRQKSSWIPRAHTSEGLIASPFWSTGFGFGHIAMWWRWLQIAIGSSFSLLLLAAASGLIKKD